MYNKYNNFYESLYISKEKFILNFYININIFYCFTHTPQQFKLKFIAHLFLSYPKLIQSSKHDATFDSLMLNVLSLL